VRAAVALLLVAGTAAAAEAQPTTSRLWRPDERTLVTDLSGVTAVAATQSVVYAATRNALAVYDRLSLSLKDVLGVADGYPGPVVSAMVADPGDDAAWLGGFGGWAVFEPFSRRFDGGSLPGGVDRVVLDASNPSQGAYYHTSAGWYFVPKMGVAAQPAAAVPPRTRWIAQLTLPELVARAPAFDVVRLEIERDAQLRTWRISGAAMTPVSPEAYVATDGNGLFRMDVTTYALARLPAGLLAAPTGAVAVAGGEVCAGVDARFQSVRRGVTCFPPDLARFDYYEGNPVSGLPGTIIRRLLQTRDALWAATDQGVLRIARRDGTVRQFDTHNGLPSLDVRALALAPQGVWIGTARGLAVVPDTGAPLRASTTLVLDAAVLSLATEGDTLWIGTTAGPYVLPPGAEAPLAAAPAVPSLAVPVEAVAVRADTVVLATDSRLAWWAGGAWHDAGQPGPTIGRYTAIAAGSAGFWVGGTLGVGFYQPARALWRALTAPGDVPQPVADVAVSRDYLWAATPEGVVRLDRRVLVP
jgi:hypothetical protein